MAHEQSSDSQLLAGPDDGLERLYSARSIRRLLDVPDRTFRRWIAAGKFPPADIRFGSTLRWKESTVREALNGKESN